MSIFSIFSKNKITINGKSYEVSGNNITVKNDSKADGTNFKFKN